ncbi:Immunoglobulin subtype 2 domain [Trichostrongylus colubriformis]|uniref:Immunoglobulin subtype 2 domain n=1 Tax=Trichostrongylus colubriformis TaxID=6319 RepID=A0AAN8IQX3_TRICO
MKRKRIHFFFCPVLLLLVIARISNALDDSYQSYIQALAYPARLVVRPDSSTVIADTKISFFCRADGNPLPNVIWKINGRPLTDYRFTVKTLPTGLSTLRIEPVLPTDNQTVVSCSADNGVANPVVADAVITVLSKAEIPSGFPAVDAHPTLKSVEQGRTAHVTCRVSRNSLRNVRS